MDELYLRRHRAELKNSQSAILPICIVVDISKSMIMYDLAGKTRMERLKEGIAEFLKEIRNDEILADSVEIAVVAFDTTATVIQKFTTIENMENVEFPPCSRAGDTPRGVETALNLLEKEKRFLSENGKNYYQPWIVIMSDGRATVGKDGDKEKLKVRMTAAQSRAKNLEKADKLTVIPVLISETTDGEYPKAKKEMQGFTVAGRCKEIGDQQSQVSFREFFRTLRKSASASVSSGINKANMIFDKPQIRGFIRTNTGAGSENIYNVPEETEQEEAYEPSPASTEDTERTYNDEHAELGKFLSRVPEQESAPEYVTSEQENSDEGLTDPTSEETANDESSYVNVSEEASYADDSDENGSEQAVEQQETPSPESEEAPDATTKLKKYDSTYVKHLLESLSDWDMI